MRSASAPSSPPGGQFQQSLYFVDVAGRQLQPGQAEQRAATWAGSFSMILL